MCGHAGVDPRKVFPHNLRHLFAMVFYRTSRDIVKLADLLGHSSICTTQVYTRLDFQHLAQVYDKAHPRAHRVSPLPEGADKSPPETKEY